VLQSLNRQQISEDTIMDTVCQKQLSFGSLFGKQVTGDLMVVALPPMLTG
jgi:hypothetical protein